MSYLVETSDQADRDLDAVNPVLRTTVLCRFFEFARSPGVAKTRPAPAPYPPGQLFEVTFPFQGELCWTGIVFKYSQDEQYLIIQRMFVEMI